MRKLSIFEEEDTESILGTRRQSSTRKQSTVTPEFQMSMLRVSLEEKQIIPPSNSEQNSRSSHRQSKLDFENIGRPR